VRKRTKKIKVNGEEILAWHIFLMLNDANVISYHDFMMRVAGRWKSDFTKGELYDLANIPRGEL